jgi:hypothetical protein
MKATATAPKVHKLLGLHFALNPWGNCFSPAMVLTTNSRWQKFVHEGKTCYPAKVTLTLRWKHMETVIYWRGALRFSWNSAHLARRFGKATEQDFGTVYQWGRHIDL